MALDDVIFFDSHQPEFAEYDTPVDKCVVGQPHQRTWHHFTSADNKFLAGFWEAEPGCWKIRYSEYEFCRIISGRSVLRDANGNERRLSAGDNFVIPAGFEGEWEVLETTRKIYVIYEP